MLFDMEGRLHINKHSKNADTGTLYTTNHPQLTTKKQITEQHALVQPPIQQNVSTNIGHRFLTLIDKHFLKDHKLRKIFNCKSMKICYGCKNNTKQTIANHNKRNLNSSKHIDDTADNTHTKDTQTAAADRRTHAHLTETASSHH